MTSTPGDTAAQAAALAAAAAQYQDALDALQQPAWPPGHAPADPYGRTVALDGGDLVVGRGEEGQRDLVMLTGTSELAQCIHVLVGTVQGSDVFNVLLGFDLERAIGSVATMREQRELVRLCVVKALAQEPRIRQLQAVAFVDEPDWLRIHPEATAEQQAALAAEQRQSRRWSLDLLLDTRLGDQLTASIQGAG